MLASTTELAGVAWILLHIPYTPHLSCEVCGASLGVRKTSWCCVSASTKNYQAFTFKRAVYSGQKNHSCARLYTQPLHVCASMCMWSRAVHGGEYLPRPHFNENQSPRVGSYHSQRHVCCVYRMYTVLFGQYWWDVWLCVCVCDWASVSVFEMLGTLFYHLGCMLAPSIFSMSS